MEWNYDFISSNLCPRQFEYHPTTEDIIFGAVNGDMCLVNREHKIITKLGNYGSSAVFDVVLGICWLRGEDCTKFISGSSDGRICCGDVRSIMDAPTSSSDDIVSSWESAAPISVLPAPSSSPFAASSAPLLNPTLNPKRSSTARAESTIIKDYEKFQRLTSVHVNRTNQHLIVSGYTQNVRIYDLETGATTAHYEGIHSDNINISRFSNLSPHLFATCSFDGSIKAWDLRVSTMQQQQQQLKLTAAGGLSALSALTSAPKPIYIAKCNSGIVMVNFSNDDTFILASALDNEISQFMFVDGRKVLQYDLPQRGLLGNYTRAYYSASSKHVYTGSCEESYVKVMCAYTGETVTTVPIHCSQKDQPMYIQSLRGSPREDNQMCVLANYRDQHHRELITVGLVPQQQQSFPALTTALITTAATTAAATATSDPARFSSWSIAAAANSKPQTEASVPADPILASAAQASSLPLAPDRPKKTSMQCVGSSEQTPSSNSNFPNSATIKQHERRMGGSLAQQHSVIGLSTQCGSGGEDLKIGVQDSDNSELVDALYRHSFGFHSQNYIQQMLSLRLDSRAFSDSLLKERPPPPTTTTASVTSNSDSDNSDVTSGYIDTLNPFGGRCKFVLSLDNSLDLFISLPPALSAAAKGAATAAIRGDIGASSSSLYGNNDRKAEEEEHTGVGMNGIVVMPIDGDGDCEIGGSGKSGENHATLREGDGGAEGDGTEESSAYTLLHIVPSSRLRHGDRDVDRSLVTGARDLRGSERVRGGSGRGRGGEGQVFGRIHTLAVHTFVLCARCPYLYHLATHPSAGGSMSDIMYVGKSLAEAMDVDVSGSCEKSGEGEEGEEGVLFDGLFESALTKQLFPVLLDYLYVGQSAVDVHVLRFACLGALISASLDRESSNIPTATSSTGSGVGAGGGIGSGGGCSSIYGDEYAALCKPRTDRKGEKGGRANNMVHAVKKLLRVAAARLRCGAISATVGGRRTDDSAFTPENLLKLCNFDSMWRSEYLLSTAFTTALFKMIRLAYRMHIPNLASVVEEIVSACLSPLNAAQALTLACPLSSTLSSNNDFVSWSVYPESKTLSTLRAHCFQYVVCHKDFVELARRKFSPTLFPSFSLSLSDYFDSTAAHLNSMPTEELIARYASLCGSSVKRRHNACDAADPKNDSPPSGAYFPPPPLCSRSSSSPTRTDVMGIARDEGMVLNVLSHRDFVDQLRVCRLQKEINWLARRKGNMRRKMDIRKSFDGDQIVCYSDSSASDERYRIVDPFSRPKRMKISNLGISSSAQQDSKQNESNAQGATSVNTAAGAALAGGISSAASASTGVASAVGRSSAAIDISGVDSSVSSGDAKEDSGDDDDGDDDNNNGTEISDLWDDVEEEEEGEGMEMEQNDDLEEEEEELDDDGFDEELVDNDHMLIDDDIDEEGEEDEDFSDEDGEVDVDGEGEVGDGDAGMDENQQVQERKLRKKKALFLSYEEEVLTMASAHVPAEEQPEEGSSDERLSIQQKQQRGICLTKYLAHSACRVAEKSIMFIGGVNSERVHRLRQLLVYTADESQQSFRYVTCNSGSNTSTASYSAGSSNSVSRIMNTVRSRRSIPAQEASDGDLHGAGYDAGDDAIPGAANMNSSVALQKRYASSVLLLCGKIKSEESSIRYSFLLNSSCVSSALTAIRVASSAPQQQQQESIPSSSFSPYDREAEVGNSYEGRRSGGVVAGKEGKEDVIADVSRLVWDLALGKFVQRTNLQDASMKSDGEGGTTSQAGKVEEREGGTVGADTIAAVAESETKRAGVRGLVYNLDCASLTWSSPTVLIGRETDPDSVANARGYIGAGGRSAGGSGGGSLVGKGYGGNLRERFSGKGMREEEEEVEQEGEEEIEEDWYNENGTTRIRSIPQHLLQRRLQPAIARPSSTGSPGVDVGVDARMEVDYYADWRMTREEIDTAHTAMSDALQWRIAPTVVAVYDEDLPYLCSLCLFRPRRRAFFGCGCCTHRKHSFHYYDSSNKSASVSGAVAREHNGNNCEQQNHQQGQEKIRRNYTTFLVQFGGYCSSSEVIRRDVHVLICDTKTVPSAAGAAVAAAGKDAPPLFATSCMLDSTTYTTYRWIRPALTGTPPAATFSHAAVVLPSAHNRFCHPQSHAHAHARSDSAGERTGKGLRDSLNGVPNWVRRAAIHSRSHTRMLLYGGIGYGVDHSQLASLRFNSFGGSPFSTSSSTCSSAAAAGVVEDKSESEQSLIMANTVDTTSHWMSSSSNGRADLHWEKVLCAGGANPGNRSGHCMVYVAESDDVLIHGGVIQARRNANTPGLCSSEIWCLHISPQVFWYGRDGVPIKTPNNELFSCAGKYSFAELEFGIEVRWSLLKQTSAPRIIPTRAPLPPNRVRVEGCYSDFSTSTALGSAQNTTITTTTAAAAAAEWEGHRASARAGSGSLAGAADARHRHTCTAVDGLLFVFGGYDESQRALSKKYKDSIMHIFQVSDLPAATSDSSADDSAQQAATTATTRTGGKRGTSNGMSCARTGVGASVGDKMSGNTGKVACWFPNASLNVQTFVSMRDAPLPRRQICSLGNDLLSLLANPLPPPPPPPPHHHHHHHIHHDNDWRNESTLSATGGLVEASANIGGKASKDQAGGLNGANETEVDGEVREDMCEETNMEERELMVQAILHKYASVSAHLLPELRLQSSPPLPLPPQANKGFSEINTSETGNAKSEILENLRLVRTANPDVQIIVFPPPPPPTSPPTVAVAAGANGSSGAGGAALYEGQKNDVLVSDFYWDDSATKMDGIAEESTEKEEISFWAHRQLLERRCEWMRMVLSGSMIEATTKSIQLHDTFPLHFHLLLVYLYSDTLLFPGANLVPSTEEPQESSSSTMAIIEIRDKRRDEMTKKRNEGNASSRMSLYFNAQDVVGLLELSNQYNLTILRTRCEGILMREMCADNACELLQYADWLGLDMLKVVCISELLRSDEVCALLFSYPSISLSFSSAASAGGVASSSSPYMPQLEQLEQQQERQDSFILSPKEREAKAQDRRGQGHGLGVGQMLPRTEIARGFLELGEDLVEEVRQFAVGCQHVYKSNVQRQQQQQQQAQLRGGFKFGVDVGVGKMGDPPAPAYDGR